jgi:hypothetical protein
MLVTYYTLKSFLVCVYQRVIFESLTQAKALATEATGVGLFPSVMQHMNVQLLASTKPFITLSARMWKNI